MSEADEYGAVAMTDSGWNVDWALSQRGTVDAGHAEEGGGHHRGGQDAGEAEDSGQLYGRGWAEPRQGIAPEMLDDADDEYAGGVSHVMLDCMHPDGQPVGCVALTGSDEDGEDDVDRDEAERGS